MPQPIDPQLRLFDELKSTRPNALKVLWNILLELRGRGANGSAGLPVTVVGGGSGGDATAAKQDAQTALLTTLSADLALIKADADNIRIATQAQMPAAVAAAVTPDDSTTFAATRSIFVGTGGAMVATIGGVDVTFTNVPDGTLLPIAATKVLVTGTDATDIVALR